MIEQLALSESRAWTEIDADEVSDVIVAAMALGGIDKLFFTSGAEIVFYQEAIAKAHALGRTSPELILLSHEHACLNAALGYAMVSGKPVATAAHVDAGTLNYGGAIHTAWRSNLPVLITSGAAPTSYPGSARGARDGGGHIWMQTPVDQNAIVRQYVKWDHRLAQHENAGTVVSRALQVALSEPRGPVFLALPKEVALAPVHGARFPTASQLGIPQSSQGHPDTMRNIVERLMAAERPIVVVSGSGRDPRALPVLVELCELLGLGVVYSTPPSYLAFPLNHTLRQPPSALRSADVVLVIDAQLPWVPEANDPPDDAYVVIVDEDPIKSKIIISELTANVRLRVNPFEALRALLSHARELTKDKRAGTFAARAQRLQDDERARRANVVAQAQAVAHSNPIDLRWLCYEIGRFVDDNCIIIDDTLPSSSAPLWDFLQLHVPGSYFGNPGTSGGWAAGAAFGAKLAAPSKDVIALSGDGFYLYSTANAALWSALTYKAPYMTIIFQNRSYSTGTLRVRSTYESSYAASAGFPGGYLDPPIDFALEAQAAGAYGENVTDPGEIAAALKRGLAATRTGQPALINVWLQKLT